jgi:2,3-bisphosphoglycerate-independent phosphoglycerate mutase
MRTPVFSRTPTVLCILDGWGDRDEARDNAIRAAATPTWDRLTSTYPTSRLDASETFVGLPSGQMGNSEVGHMNLGAGRVVLQDLPRIDDAIQSGALSGNAALDRFAAAVKAKGGTAHILGLLSDGGVHSHQNHMAALVDLLESKGVPVAVHGFLDGRDTPPRSAKDLIGRFGPADRIATLCGRYWAMDRDNRWDRVEKAHALVTRAVGAHVTDPLAAVDASYAADIGDEFLNPVAIGGYRGMRDGDGILMANFRADRARQILTALLDPSFDGFWRSAPISFSAALGMVEYSEAHSRFMETLFPPEPLDDVLGAVIAKAGGRQLRIAETEKYAHVTFFLNGGREAVFDGEERILVPSPDVPTYDLKPEMSAVEVTDKLVEAIENDRFDLIVVNYANTDMVGHTGDFDAARRAVEAVDGCLSRLEAAVLTAGGAMLITADHGNADIMVDPETKEPHTAHTLSRVPLVLVGEGLGVTGLDDGRLADVAPTVLDIMGIARPPAMTGRRLTRRAASHAAE